MDNERPAPDRTQQIRELIQLCLPRLDLVQIDGAYQIFNTTWSVPRDERTDFELIYILKGAAQLEIHGQRYEARAGEMYIADNREGNTCTFCDGFILFCTFSVPSAVPSAGPSDPVALYRKVKHCIRFMPRRIPVRRQEPFEQLFLSMTREFMLRPPLHRECVNVLWLQLWVEIYRDLEQQSVKPPDYVSPRHQRMVKEIQAYLTDHPYDRASLADIAARWGLSPRFVNRIFKKAAGYPIAAFRKRLRIELAKSLLHDNKGSITHISEQLGFANPQHFSRAFKQVTQLTPSEFQRKGR